MHVLIRGHSGESNQEDKDHLRLLLMTWVLEKPIFIFPIWEWHFSSCLRLGAVGTTHLQGWMKSCLCPWVRWKQPDQQRQAADRIYSSTQIITSVLSQQLLEHYLFLCCLSGASTPSSGLALASKLWLGPMQTSPEQHSSLLGLDLASHPSALTQNPQRNKDLPDQRCLGDL